MRFKRRKAVAVVRAILADESIVLSSGGSIFRLGAIAVEASGKILVGNDLSYSFGFSGPGWYGLMEEICAPVDEIDNFNRRVRDPAGGVTR